MSLLRLLLVFAVLPLVACGDKEKEETGDTIPTGDPIDCAWFDGDNCWKDLVVDAMACAPPADAWGVFSTDMTTCTFQNGTEVVFDVALDLAAMDDYVWKFSVVSGGSTCMRWDEEGDSLSVTAGGDTFRQDLVGMEMVLQCPAGDAYTIGAFDALNCDWNNLPGYAWSTGGSSLTFQILGQDDRLFGCE